MSKGSSPRPFSISQHEYDTRWDAIFNRDIHEDNMQVKVTKGKVGTCGCGRSPTGNCIGWHGLTKEEFARKLEEYRSQNTAIEP